MKSFLKILFAPLLSILQGCNPLGNAFDEEVSENHYYNNSRTDVIYSPMGNWFELGKAEMGVDMKSFKVLNSVLSKDKDHVYYESYTIKDRDIDIPSFQAKANGYMTNYGFDKNNVYFLETDYKDGEGYAISTIIQEADPESFQKIDHDWGKDASNYFYRNKVIEVDYSTFRNLHNYFSKDDSTVYMHYNGSFMKISASAPTFTIVDTSDYAYDKNNLYHPSFEKDDANGIQLLTIEHDDIDKIKLYNKHYLLSGGNIYYRGLMIEGATRTSFEVISDRYAKDETTVFFEEKKVEGADVKTFKISDDGLIVYDKHGNYRDGKLFVVNATN